MIVKLTLLIFNLWNIIILSFIKILNFYINEYNLFFFFNEKIKYWQKGYILKYY